MGLFNNKPKKSKPKKLKPKKITLAQAIKYAKIPEYSELYEFIPVNLENINEGYIPVLKEELSRKVDYIDSRSVPFEKKENNNNKRKQSFIDRIKVEVDYNKLKQNTAEKIKDERPKYGDYQSAKKYKGDIR